MISPYEYPTDEFFLKMLLSLPSAVQFGSRVLGVASEDSDYDIAILRSDLPEGLIPYTNNHKTA